MSYASDPENDVWLDADYAIKLDDLHEKLSRQFASFGR